MCYPVVPAAAGLRISYMLMICRDKIIVGVTAVMVLLSMCVAACGSSSAVDEPTLPAAASMAFAGAGDTLGMNVGDQTDLVVEVRDAEGRPIPVPDKDIRWYTTSDRVVSVAAGSLKAVGTGTAQISAHYSSLHCDVSVEVRDGSGEDPDADNLTGYVRSTDGRGIAGVVVSDGDLCVVTDAEGHYSLRSDKRCGYVFISIPSGYEAECTSDMIPMFYRTLSPRVATVEQHDFELTPVDQSRFMLVAATDHHVANRQSQDLAQFRWEKGLFSDVRETVAKAGCPVYSVFMGDMSWDEYWYQRNYSIADYRKELSRNGYPTAVFHTMGNHDNNPYCTDDWRASELYRREIGPTYYSFNIGRAHFVVLDNIIYQNTGGEEGKIGKLNYREAVDAAQLSWLERDLSMVEDKSAPLVLVMHATLYRWRKVDGAIGYTTAMAGAYDIINRVRGFDDVYVISGHSHVNQRIDNPASGIHEVNVAATSGTWWWTGTYHSEVGFDCNVCLDGSPGGYEVFTFDGNDVSWRYKGIGRPDDYAFRAYDMNEVLKNSIIAAAAPDFTSVATADGVEDCYAENDILINIWDWEQGWTLRVTEEGRELQGVQVRGKDPMHKISYIGKTAPFQTGYNCHMWKFRASSPTSTVVIEATDLFGRTYTQTMERPKAFSVAMR